MINKPAFPTTQYANGISPTGHTEGMTLRDYFAAKAMQALFSDPDVSDTSLSKKVIAVSSYAIADAMLEARK
jgi:hypothetical protein